MARQYESLRRLSRLFDTEDEALGVATPSAYFPGFSGLVTKAAPGADLLSVIKERLSFFPSAKAIEGTERACALCGRWLKALQEATPFPDAQWSLEDRWSKRHRNASGRWPGCRASRRAHREKSCKGLC